ncbi:MAG: sigma-70 family RNA polymerase sigma factor [Oscillospiraceae bacterium]|nr:sigma-70 family RNA polymerase sigma factor [Oscillospiraceae bacterium]
MEQKLTQQQLDTTAERKQAEKELVQELVERAMLSDREALKDLCRVIARSVLFRVSCKIHNRNDAEDTSQEVLIRVCEKIDGLRDKEAFEAWLNKIIMNEIARSTAKNAKRASVVNIDDYLDDGFDEEDNAILPDDYVIRAEDRTTVMEIIKSLPDRQLEAVMLHYYRDMSVTETATAMDVSHPTVSRYLKLAREKIRFELQHQAERADTYYSFALVPLGRIISQVLQQESISSTLMSDAWLSKAVRRAGSTGIAAAIRYSLGVGVGFTKTISICVITTVVLISGLGMGGAFRYIGEDILPPIARIVETNGEIVFSDAYGNHTAINPVHADVWANNERGDLSVRYWWITSADNSTTVFTGVGNSVDDALLKLVQSNMNGDYLLHFFMEDNENVIHQLIRTFKIYVQ